MNITRNHIEQTKAFTSLEPFKQKILRQANNMKHLTRTATIAYHSGFEQWKSQQNPKESEIKIIKEVLETLNKL